MYSPPALAPEISGKQLMCFFQHFPNFWQISSQRMHRLLQPISGPQAKCGFESAEPHWDEWLQLWRSKCLRMTTHAVAGAKRRCAHETFSLLGLKIYGQTWWLSYALIHPIIYFLWIGNVRKYFFHLSTSFCLKRLQNFNSSLLFQVKRTGGGLGVPQS